MKHVSTPENYKKNEVKQRTKELSPYSPCKWTLSFLIQFASVYHVEKELPLDLGEMILN